MKTRKLTKKSCYKRTAQELDRELATTSLEARTVYPPPPREKDWLAWESVRGPKRSKSFRILTAPNYSAQGMHLIYGRGDNFHRLSCGLNMFLRKDGRVFFRFYSPTKRVTYRSYELLGLKLPPLPEPGRLLKDDCVPEILRDLYGGWATECIQYPVDID